MNKQEVSKLMQSIAKEQGFELTLKDVDALIKIFNDVILTIGENVEKKENGKGYNTINLGCVSITRKERKAREGKVKFKEGEDIDWTTPGREVISLKLKKSFEKEHEEIIG